MPAPMNAAEPISHVSAIHVPDGLLIVDHIPVIRQDMQSSHLSSASACLASFCCCPQPGFSDEDAISNVKLLPEYSERG